MKDKRNFIGVEKHIRITDIEIGKQIERIMELPEYKSLNKVITEALFYGVPMLCEKLFGEVRLEEATPYYPPIKSNELEDRHFRVMIQLLKEMVMNVVINKSILSSLFHAKEYDNKGLRIDNEMFTNGLMNDTPDYLYEFEIESLKKMQRER
ncbi:MAG: hypothetical protein K2L12_04400 [Clostridia bacterium]|nr:hypothetical protein [Clostridia bacterium]